MKRRNATSVTLVKIGSWEAKESVLNGASHEEWSSMDNSLIQKTDWTSLGVAHENIKDSWGSQSILD